MTVLLLLVLSATSPAAPEPEAACPTPCITRVADEAAPAPTEAPPVQVDASVEAKGEGGGIAAYVLHAVRPSALALGAGVGAFLLAAAWGALAGGGAGALIVMSTFFPSRVNDRYFGPSLALLGGLGAVSGVALAVPLGLVTAVLVDGLVWLALTAPIEGPLRAGPPAHVLAESVVLAGAAALAVAGSAVAGLVLLSRAPTGGLERDVFGTMLMGAGTFALAVLPLLPVVALASTAGRAAVWRLLDDSGPPRPVTELQINVEAE